MIEENVCNLGLLKTINRINDQRHILSSEHTIRAQITITRND